VIALPSGKTTVATIYGRVLRDLGLLSKGDVVVKVPADFIGSVLGESEKRTLAILEESRGCVLVIDEAYGLHSSNKFKDPYKVGWIGHCHMFPCDQAAAHDAHDIWTTHTHGCCVTSELTGAHTASPDHVSHLKHGHIPPSLSCFHSLLYAILPLLHTH
jgi:hypothetical protein